MTDETNNNTDWYTTKLGSFSPKQMEELYNGLIDMRIQRSQRSLFKRIKDLIVVRA